MMDEADAPNFQENCPLFFHSFLFSDMIELRSKHRKDTIHLVILTTNLRSLYAKFCGVQNGGCAEISTIFPEYLSKLCVIEE